MDSLMAILKKEPFSGMGKGPKMSPSERAEADAMDRLHDGTLRSEAGKPIKSAAQARFIGNPKQRHRTYRGENGEESVDK